MSDNKTQTPDTLTRIWQVCRSPYLSKDAKLAYVMLATPETCNANTCCCDPPEDVKDGLCELARVGLIRLEIIEHEYRARIIPDCPVFAFGKTLEGLRVNNLSNLLLHLFFYML